MESAGALSSARRRARWSLRHLADAAATSHSTISAYEQDRVDPTVGTLARIVQAAGYELEVTLVATTPDHAHRAQELLDVLELAEQFPSRHSRALTFPRFGHR